MSLQEWADNGWLRPHWTSRQEIADLLAMADRDLRDACGSISADWRFGIAYNAALKLCTVLVYASGFRPERELSHCRAVHSLPPILGDVAAADADYLDSCRRKRNTVEYERVGGVAERDVEELITFARQLRRETVNWLARSRPDLLKP